MSASLVGSEMCIRDRSSGNTRWATGSRPARSARRQACSSAASSLQPYPSCLLYTSDAADDM
eukprot:3061630-Alexandrium_andersonii.AAC.1